jgi:hypothetical protein
MEPRKIETPGESHSECQTSLPHQPERKRRFQIVKLEEQIAPSGGGKSDITCKALCGPHYTHHPGTC